MSRRLPVSIIVILSEWYGKSSAVVAWNGARSANFKLLCGVRQGGALSPVLFSVFVNDVILAVVKRVILDAILAYSACQLSCMLTIYC